MCPCAGRFASKTELYCERKIVCVCERQKKRDTETQRNYDLQVILFLILWLYMLECIWYFVSRLYRILIGFQVEIVVAICVYAICFFSFSFVLYSWLYFDWFLLCLPFGIHALCVFVVVVFIIVYIFFCFSLSFRPFFTLFFNK